MEDFNLFTFPHKCNIERYNNDTKSFETVYVNKMMDIQSIPRSYNQFFPFVIDTFFMIRVLMFQATEDIRVGDRVTVIDGFVSPTSTKEIQQYIIKDISDMSGDEDFEYIHCKAGQNTLLSKHRIEKIKRISKSNNSNYDPILDEYYGETEETYEEFDANVVQSVRVSRYSNNADFGMFKDAQYDVILDSANPIFIDNPLKIDDIVIYNDEKYKIKYVYNMPNPIKIMMVGISSLNNDTK